MGEIPVAPKNTSASEEGVFDGMPSFIGSDIAFMSLIAFLATLLLSNRMSFSENSHGIVPNFCFVRIVSNFQAMKSRADRGENCSCREQHLYFTFYDLAPGSPRPYKLTRRATITAKKS